MSYLATLVAFGTTAAAVATTTEGTNLLGGIVAITRQMTGLATTVARFLLGWACAVTTHVAILPTVIANRSSTFWALTGLVTSLAAIVTGSSIISGTEIHFGCGW
jgi:hypothetical protein